MNDKNRRRFGKVRKLPSGRWQASYIAPDGMRYAAPGTFRTETDAGKWLTVVESDILRGVWRARPVETFTVRQWSERWLSAHESHIKRTTAGTYRTALRAAILPTFGRKTLGNVRPIDVAEWLAKLTADGKSPGWVRQCYRLLSMIMRAAVENDLIEVTPCRGHRLPRTTDPEPVILTTEQIAELASHCKHPSNLLVLLLGYAGLRIGEAFALRQRDIRDAGRTITVAQRKAEIAGKPDFDLPKSHQVRTLRVPEFLAVKLVAHSRTLADGDALLFVGARGRVLSYNVWRRGTFDPAVEKVGLVGVTPHDLRASHATWVADRFGVLAAAKRLGHSNASVTTRHYARAVEQRDDDVATELDGLQGDSGQGKSEPPPEGTPGARDDEKES